MSFHLEKSEKMDKLTSKTAFFWGIPVQLAENMEIFPGHCHSLARLEESVSCASLPGHCRSLVRMGDTMSGALFPGHCHSLVR